MTDGALGRMKWTRLADGWWLLNEHPVLVGREGGRGVPIRVLVPAERDLNFRDGWMWREVVDTIKVSDALFWNLPGAKAWVEEHLHDQVLVQSEPGYDGDPVAAAVARVEEHNAYRARNHGI